MLKKILKNPSIITRTTYQFYRLGIKLDISWLMWEWLWDINRDNLTNDLEYSELNMFINKDFQLKLARRHDYWAEDRERVKSKKQDYPILSKSNLSPINGTILPEYI